MAQENKLIRDSVAIKNEIQKLTLVAIPIENQNQPDHTTAVRAMTKPYKKTNPIF